MTYSGSTAGTTLSNPPILVSQGGIGGVNQISTGAGGGNKIWRYDSSNATSDLLSANYITDAQYLGMKAGDIVIGTVATGSSVSVFLGVVGTVSTSGAALASSGGVLSSTR
ncbi:MAG TPA: hypothetical protein VF151_10855 [Gemmatimonadales bacterium]